MTGQQAITNLGTEDVEATEKTNDTGRMTEILEFSPIDGLVLQIMNKGGDVDFFAKLRDSNDELLPNDTELVFRFNGPSLDQPMHVSEKLTNIGVWNRLTLAQQQDEEYSDRIGIQFDGRGVAATQIETVEIAIKSSAQIDWDNSQVEIDRDNARTVSN